VTEPRYEILFAPGARRDIGWHRRRADRRAYDVPPQVGRRETNRP